MGTLVASSVQSEHSIIAIIMGLHRYMLLMFLMILSTNIFQTEAEQTKDKEDEREKNLDRDSNIMKNAKDGPECNTLAILGGIFCHNFKNIDRTTGNIWFRKISVAQ